MTETQPRRRLNLIDLYSGVGGLSMGFCDEASDGVQIACRAMVDSDPEARETIVRNDPRRRVLVEDVGRVDGTRLREAAGMTQKEPLHVLVGGPPCQGFSWLGRRALDDERNGALLDFLRLVKELRPLAVVMENVPLIITSHEGTIIREITEGLSASGYSSCADVLVASEYGVPQLRRRAFVLAYRADLGLPPSFPARTHERIPSAAELRAQVERVRFEPTMLPYVSVEEAIGDLPRLGQGGGSEVIPYDTPPSNAFQRWAREGSMAVFNHRARVHSGEFLKKISVIKEGGRNQELPSDKRFSDTYFSQAYARLYRGGIAQTVTTSFSNPGSGRFMHYDQLRSITVREAARFQTFPDRFVLHGIYQSQQRHVGNAVPVLLARALRNQIVHDLEVSGALDERSASSRPTPPIRKESPAQRSKVMRAVPSRNTSAELALRRALGAIGIRGYRLHSSAVPGHPDLIFPTARIAVFVDGCFWHGCAKCYRAPKSHVEYWTMKVERNRSRDKRIDGECRAAGWRPVRVWEHLAMKDPKKAADKVQQALKGASSPGPSKRRAHGTRS